MNYDEDRALGKVTRSTAIRLQKALTWKGLEHYRKNLAAGMSPRQAIHDVVLDSRQREKVRQEKALVDFILYGWDVAKMSIPEFIKACNRDAKRRWETFRPDELKRIFKNWRAKTLQQTLEHYEQDSLGRYDKGEDFAFRFMHVDRIREAIEYKLDFNQEACEYYKRLNLL